MESMTVTPFYEDIYLYDLNAARSLPLAHRSARGGQTQPDLLSLIKLPACEWHAVAAHLHDGAVYLSSDGGAVLLPVYGGIGRLVAVVKTNLSLPALSYGYSRDNHKCLLKRTFKRLAEDRKNK